MSQFERAPDNASINNPSQETKANLHRHPTILRVSGVGIAGILATLMITAVAPPILADQSDRAVVNAPVTLITASIAGEIDSLSVQPGSEATVGQKLAEISNARVDRTSLISLEEK